MEALCSGSGQYGSQGSKLGAPGSRDSSVRLADVLPALQQLLRGNAGFEAVAGLAREHLARGHMYSQGAPAQVALGVDAEVARQLSLLSHRGTPDASLWADQVCPVGGGHGLRGGTCGGSGSPWLEAPARARLRGRCFGPVEKRRRALLPARWRSGGALQGLVSERVRSWPPGVARRRKRALLPARSRSGGPCKSQCAASLM